MTPSPSLSKMEKRLAVLKQANWHREQQLMMMDSACMYLEYANLCRTAGNRKAAARYLDRAAARVQEATLHYTTMKRLEGKNVHP